MFGFFSSSDKKMRDHAASWLELAEKVLHYRRDVLPPNDLAELRAGSARLQGEIRQKAAAERLKLSIAAVEQTLQRTGGKLHPKSSLVENVEFFLVAAIVILGIRAYFLQPFKIPTNSMWPSYHGMTPEVFRDRAEEPGAGEQALRFVAFGASSRRLDAPVSGEILIPVGNVGGRAGVAHYQVVSGRKWFVIPTQLREYRLYVNDAPVSVEVPLDFDFDWALREAYFPGAGKLEDAIMPLIAAGKFEWREVVEDGRRVRMQFIRTGRTVAAGERLLSFDILTGDQLFVDRMSYHFVAPSVGSGFVFRTKNIPGIADTYGDQYYVKRLVGTPGDTLEILRPKSETPGNGSRSNIGTLLRNGEPIMGSAAFSRNNAQEGRYRGYQALGLLQSGRTVEVPEHAFFTLGDNSGNSSDSRYWGFVPEKDVIGRPLVIYYPFTRRWGPAR
ncbi:MAG: signal peptidase I [Verrucomicrobia bacterium]|nr:signal peptidase I [Verrucomicrobiota bacterium]